MVEYILVLIVLVLVLFLAFYSLKFLKKSMHLYQSSKNIQVVESAPISTKGQVSVVKVNGKYFMLGVTEQNIQLLKEFEEFEEIQSNVDSNMALDFKSILMKYSKKGDSNE